MGVNHAFAWEDTVDGRDYWNSVLEKLEGLRDHGTSDYKPLQPKQPEITDEWLIRFIQNHGRRPLVLVKDFEESAWSKPVPLVMVQKPYVGFCFRVMGSGGRFRFCKLADGEPLE